jgi:hypothetical protein
MAKAIKTKVDYQVTELVNNLSEAATSTSEQKRDFYTTRALYNAKRLSTILGKAKVGAMMLILGIGMTACGNGKTSEVASDSTAVAIDSTTTITADSTATAVDSTSNEVK